MAKVLVSDINVDIRVKQERCKGCGICTALCDRNVLMLDSRQKAVVANPDNCTGCGRCESHCPDFAIFVNREKEK